MKKYFKLIDMKNRAERLYLQTSNVRPLLMRILINLTEADVENFRGSEIFDTSAYGRISQKLQVPTNMVRRSFLNIEADLKDYTDSYREMLEDYHALYSKEMLDVTFQGLSSDTIPFLLHGMVNTWTPRWISPLGSLVIEDRNIDRFARGLLVFRERAFSDSLELLETAAKEEWANWQILWKDYF